MTSVSRSHAAQMRSHWWLRPGWYVGRQMYTWHWTFDGQRQLHETVRHLHSRLSEAGGVDLVEIPWLHLTTQGVGFVDETDHTEVKAIAEAARHRCSHLSPVEVTLGPLIVDPESIQFAVHPIDRLAEVRAALRAAIADVWGPERIPEPSDGWRPHVSVAYSDSEGPAERLIEAIGEVAEQEPQLTLDMVQLIALTRGEHAYTWSVVATVPLAGAGF